MDDRLIPGKSSVWSLFCCGPALLLPERLGAAMKWGHQVFPYLSSVCFCLRAACPMGHAPHCLFFSAQFAKGRNGGGRLQTIRTLRGQRNSRWTSFCRWLCPATLFRAAACAHPTSRSVLGPAQCIQAPIPTHPHSSPFPCKI